MGDNSLQAGCVMLRIVWVQWLRATMAMLLLCVLGHNSTEATRHNRSDQNPAVRTVQR